MTTSGLLTSLYRTLGIPARSVTNFCSGHDHDDSNTIDIHFDHLGNSLSEYDDSTWNFHVWVEAWFTRRDLRNSKYDGWQVRGHVITLYCHVIMSRGLFAIRIMTIVTPKSRDFRERIFLTPYEPIRLLDT